MEAQARGEVLVAPLPVWLRPRTFREPDLLCLLHEERIGPGANYPRGAGLVSEVVSASDANRDDVEKRRDYAQAGIPEYWIVDPAQQTILVLVLHGQVYEQLGLFKTGMQARSVILGGFEIDVDAVFAPAS